MGNGKQRSKSIDNCKKQLNIQCNKQAPVRQSFSLAINSTGHSFIHSLAHTLVHSLSYSFGHIQCIPGNCTIYYQCTLLLLFFLLATACSCSSSCPSSVFPFICYKTCTLLSRLSRLQFDWLTKYMLRFLCPHRN